MFVEETGSVAEEFFAEGAAFPVTHEGGEEDDAAFGQGVGGAEKAGGQAGREDLKDPGGVAEQAAVCAGLVEQEEFGDAGGPEDGEVSPRAADGVAELMVGNAFCSDDEARLPNDGEEAAEHQGEKGEQDEDAVAARRQFMVAGEVDEDEGRGEDEPEQREDEEPARAEVVGAARGAHGVGRLERTRAMGAGWNDAGACGCVAQAA